MPAEPPSLMRSAAWSVLGNAIFLCAQWGVLIILARSFPVGVMGAFALAIAIATPAFTFANLQLRVLVATDPLRRHANVEYVLVRLGGVVAATFVSTAAWAALGGSTPLILMALVIAAKACESGSDLCLGFLQRAERNDIIAVSLILRGVATIAACLWLTASVGTPLAVVAGMAGANAAVLLFHDLPRSRRQSGAPGPVGSCEGVPRLIRAGLPMGLTLLASTLAISVPRLFLERTLGLDAVAVYSALAYLVMTGSIAVAAVGAPFSTRLAALHAAGDSAGFHALGRRLLAIAAGLGLLGTSLAVLCGDPLVRLIYGPAYAGHQAVLLILCLAGLAAMVSSAQGILMTATRIHGAQLTTGLIALVVLVLACAVLVPGHGLAGAANASLIAGATMVALRWRYLRTTAAPA